MSILTAEALNVAFGGVRALNDVTLRLEAGRIYGLIGPNGAGKTTLFNVLTGVVLPRTGKLTLGESDITKTPPHKRARAGLGRTFQNLALFPSMTVEQNVRAGLLGQSNSGWVLRILGRREESASAELAVQEALHYMGLEAQAASPVTALPLGTRKKVELARAIVSRPKVLLLDEPAAGLGAEGIKELCALIRQFQAGGMTVLVVEHHMAMVMGLCEEIFVLNFGTLIAQGPPAAVRQHPEVIKAYLGTEVAHASV